MSKKKQQQAIEQLTKALHVSDVKFNETPDNAAWCLGYLEGIVKDVINQLKD